MGTATRRCDPDLNRVFPLQVMPSRKPLTGVPRCLDFSWFQMWSSWQQRLSIRSANLGDCKIWTQELEMYGSSRRVQRSPPGAAQPVTPTWGQDGRRDLVCVWASLEGSWVAGYTHPYVPESATSLTSSGSINASLKARCWAEGICEPVTRWHILVELSICPILSYITSSSEHWTIVNKSFITDWKCHSLFWAVHIGWEKINDRNLETLQGQGFCVLIWTDTQHPL